MRIAIVHPALGTEDLREAFALAADAGADGIEIRYASAATATVLGRPEHARQLAELTGKTEVAIPSLHLDCFRAEPALIGRQEIIDGAQQVLLRALGAASEAGAEMVTVPFFGKNAIELEEELTRAANALLDMVEHAEEAGVVIAVESTLAFHQEQFLLNHLGSTGDVKVCCNTGVALSRKLDVVTGIRQLPAGDIAFVRFRDVRIAEGAPPDFDVPLGEGHVDFGAVVQAIHAVGYDGWVIVEPPPVGGGPREAVRAAEKAVDFAREILKDAAG